VAVPSNHAALFDNLWPNARMVPWYWLRAVMSSSLRLMNAKKRKAMKREGGNDPLRRLWSSSGVAGAPDSGSRSWSFVLFLRLSILRIGGRGTGVWCRMRQLLGSCDEVLNRPSSQAGDERRLVGPVTRWGRGMGGGRGMCKGRGCDPVGTNRKSGLRNRPDYASYGYTL
jgi:hypothetical protein